MFWLVAAMDYFVGAFLKLAELDANYFDTVSPATPEPRNQQQRRQQKIICPALASPMPDSPLEDRGEKRRLGAAPGALLHFYVYVSLLVWLHDVCARDSGE
jgi:hypothetical protein